MLKYIYLYFFSNLRVNSGFLNVRNDAKYHRKEHSAKDAISILQVEKELAYKFLLNVKIRLSEILPRVRALQKSYLLALQTFTSFLVATKQAFEYLISKGTWYTLEWINVSFDCAVTWCRVWSTGMFLCVCLDHGDSLLLSRFSGALQGLDLIKDELSSHQDAAIESMYKWWLTPISGAGFHNFIQISIENHSCFIVYIINC